MHVALLAGLLFWLARRLHMREVLATVVTLAQAFAYALLTGFGVPVQRALLMTAVFLIARLLSRQRNALNALGAAALAVLVWSPRALFEASFQMTFLAIVAIAGIAMPLGERTFLRYAYVARKLRDRWRDTAVPPLSCELCCDCGAMPSRRRSARSLARCRQLPSAWFSGLPSSR
jgi:competence protein ComEC